MCLNDTANWMAPAGALKYKWADPLGLTKTPIGDPTGQHKQRREIYARATGTDPASIAARKRRQSLLSSPVNVERSY